MNKEHISKVQDLLTEWNPLGKTSTLLIDLNNYEIEAVDILFHLKNNNTVEQISKIIYNVLNQAFDIQADQVKCKIIAEQIQRMINKK